MNENQAEKPASRNLEFLLVSLIFVRMSQLNKILQILLNTEYFNK